MLEVRYRSDTKKRLDSMVKTLDSHISKLDAKLLYLIHSYDPEKEFFYNYEKRREVVRNEIEYTIKLKNRLMKLYDILEGRGGNTDMINDIMGWDSI